MIWSVGIELHSIFPGHSLPESCPHGIVLRRRKQSGNLSAITAVFSRVQIPSVLKALSSRPAASVFPSNDKGVRFSDKHSQHIQDL
jgi:transposase